MSSDLTSEGFSETLTGYEEAAIEEHMGIDVYLQGEFKPVLLVRAMIFVDHMRHGLGAADAKDTALKMPAKDLKGYFAEDNEITPDAPTTDTGKEGSPESDGQMT